MLGKAPTRTVLAGAWAKTETTVVSQSSNATKKFLLTLTTPDDHGQDAGRIFLLIFLTLGTLADSRAADGDQVRQTCVVEDTSGGIANVEEYLVEGTVG